MFISSIVSIVNCQNKIRSFGSRFFEISIILLKSSSFSEKFVPSSFIVEIFLKIIQNF